MSNLDSDFNSLVSDISGPLPIDYLRSLLFDSLDPMDGKKVEGFEYSTDEKRMLLDLARREKNKISGLMTYKRPMWISSAGGPGAGKSTALFQYIAELYGIKVIDREWLDPALKTATEKVFEKVPIALVSPDKSSLMTIARRKGRGPNPTIDAEFYRKWRWALYFLSGVATNAGFTNGANVVYDTTLSGAHSLNSLEAASKAGYYVAVLMQGAPAIAREEAIEKRNESFVQVLPHNVKVQDDLFAQKIPEIISRSDEVIVAWRDKANSPSKHVAMILDNRYLTVSDQKGFEKFCSAYPVMRDVLDNLEKNEASERRGQLASIIKGEMRGTVAYGKPVFQIFSHG